MRRRRKSRATWFPILPTFYPGSEGGDSDEGVTFYQANLIFPNTSVGGDTVITAIPLVPDTTETNAIAGTQEGSLRDYVEGQDYVLKRVVGKVWMSFSTVGGDPPPTLNVAESIGCIALAVLPATTDTNSPSIPAEEYNPFFARNVQQPWIWRRTWRLDNPNNWLRPDGGNFPFTTAQYGSVLDGGHLDSKMARRITKEHRLYLIAAAAVVSSFETVPDGFEALQFGYDLRVLGSMRKGRNTSSF